MFFFYFNFYCHLCNYLFSRAALDIRTGSSLSVPQWCGFCIVVYLFIVHAVHSWKLNEWTRCCSVGVEFWEVLHGFSLTFCFDMLPICYVWNWLQQLRYFLRLLLLHKSSDVDPEAQWSHPQLMLCILSKMSQIFKAQMAWYCTVLCTHFDKFQEMRTTWKQIWIHVIL